VNLKDWTTFERFWKRRFKVKEGLGGQFEYCVSHKSKTWNRTNQ
jgi:hypothetical protein